MTRTVADAVLDEALQYLASNASRMDACSAAPTSYAEATSTYTLANVTLDSDDYTVGDGDTSGRKATIAEQADIAVTGSDTATHVALTNGSDTLYYVTECGSVALSSDATVTFSAWDIEILDPSS